ncbi:MAG: Riboflavin transporter [Chlamydiae bacterium]|nr:Riboflavin transporter [Chlamydiota bacterium]
MKVFNFFQHYNLKKGIFLVILAWLCFSTLYMLAKVIEKQTTIPTMLFFRNVLGLAFIAPFIFKEWPKSLEVKNIKIVVIRSMMGILSLFFIFLAVQKISLVNTTLLNNSAPLFVPFIVWFWLKKPVNHKLWPAVIFGFIGIALILQPDSRIFNLGSAYALASGLCLAVTFITMRMASKKENLSSFLLYFFAIGMVATLPFAIFDWKIENGWILLALFGIGLMSFMGQVLFYYALKFGKAHHIAPFTYSAVVFSGIYEWLIWDKAPSLIAYIGMVLIIASGIWIVLLNPGKNS